MIEQLLVIDKVRRLAATQSEQWHSIGREVFDENHGYVLRADSDNRASYLASLHNNFLMTCSLLFQLVKKRVDKRNMKREQQIDP